MGGSSRARRVPSKPRRTTADRLWSAARESTCVGPAYQVVAGRTVIGISSSSARGRLKRWGHSSAPKMTCPNIYLFVQDAHIPGRHRHAEHQRGGRGHTVGLFHTIPLH
jgi:hypothetical protein